jgi:hypothetical protein
MRNRTITATLLLATLGLAAPATAGVFYFELDEDGTNAYDSFNGPIFGSGNYWSLNRVNSSRSVNEAADPVPNPETGAVFSHPAGTDGAAANDHSVWRPRFYQRTNLFQMRNEPWTFEGWFQNDNDGVLPGGLDSRQTICATRCGFNGDYDGWYLAMWGDRYLRLRVDSTDGVNVLVSNDPFADTAFHHFAVTWDPNDGPTGTVELFVDGTSQGTVAGRGYPLYAGGYESRYFTLGAAEGNSSGPFDMTDSPWEGRLDEIRYTYGPGSVLEPWQFLNGTGDPPVGIIPEPAGLALLFVLPLVRQRRR